VASVVNAVSLSTREMDSGFGMQEHGGHFVYHAQLQDRRTKTKLLRKQLISSGSQRCLINNKKINSGSVPEFFFYG